MKVLELPVARSTNRDLRPRRQAAVPIPLTRLAPALTIAAAAGGIVEVLLERIVGPMLTHVAGPSLAPLATTVSRVGAIAVAASAVLVLLAAVAWAGEAWERHGIVAVAVLAAVATTLAAGIYGGSSALVLLHLTVAVAATGTVLAARLPGVYGGAVALVAVAIVAGQWSLSGSSGEFTVAARIIAEAALVVALLLFAASVSRPLRRRSIIGLSVGALIAAAALMSSRTPLVALWASGATLWMPSLVYIGAGAAVGLLLANWLPDRSTRHLAAGLALLAVAGIEPTLVHHNVTALVGLLALASSAERTAP